MQKINLSLVRLESRECPAQIAYSATDRTLRINGDPLGAEQVTININDVADTLEVAHAPIPTGELVNPLPVVQSFKSSEISRIITNLGAGDDRFNVVLSSQTYLRAKTFSVNLGAGNDSAVFDFGGQLVVPMGGPITQPFPTPRPASLFAHLNIDVNAGIGNDTVSSIFGHIGVGSNLTYRANLGEGNDVAAFDLEGAVQANARVTNDFVGGAGNDQIVSDLGYGNIQTNAVVNTYLDGGLGNDFLSSVYRGTLDGTFNTRYWGGAGDDSLFQSYTLGYLSNGSVISQGDAGAGNDTLTGEVVAQPVPANVRITPRKLRVYSLMNGGDGIDLGRFWVGIRSVNIEQTGPFGPIPLPIPVEPVPSPPPVPMPTPVPTPVA